MPPLELFVSMGNGVNWVLRLLLAQLLRTSGPRMKSLHWEFHCARPGLGRAWDATAKRWPMRLA